MFHLHGRELNVGLSSMVVVSSSYDHHHIVAVQGNGQQHQHQRNHKHSSLFLIRERYPTPTSQKSKGSTNDLDWSGSSVSALNWVKLWSEWAGQRSLIELIDVDGDDLVFLYFSFSLFETFFHIIELIGIDPALRLFSSNKCLLCLRYLLNIFENIYKVWHLSVPDSNQLIFLWMGSVKKR